MTSTLGRRRPRRIVCGRNVSLLSLWFGDSTGLGKPGPKGLVARGAVVGRFGYQRFEEREVVALLGMPEDADRKAPRWILDALDRAVGGVSRHAEAVADSAEALV